MRKALGLIVTALTVTPVALEAQTTGMPSYNAPHRAFARHEFGGTLSFPEGGDFGIEGQYRFGNRTWDIGFRGGVFDPGVGDAIFLAGVEGRSRVITHTEQFPLDGAVVVGVGGWLGDNSVLFIPAGLSLGRRILIEDSQVSIVPYAQPTVFLTANGGTDVQFALGLGADFRLSSMFDARVSVGVGDLEGISVSAVWLR